MISFDCLSLLKYIVNQEFLNKLEEIQNLFDFHRTVRLFCYTNYKIMEKKVGRMIPSWVTGISDGKSIYIVLNNFSSVIDIEKLVLHEYVHVATHYYYKDKLPIWLNEGLALVIAEQTCKNIDYIDQNYLREDYCGYAMYDQSYFIVQRLVKQYGLEYIIEQARTIDCKENEILSLNNILDLIKKTNY